MSSANLLENQYEQNNRQIQLLNNTIRTLQSQIQNLQNNNHLIALQLGRQLQMRTQSMLDAFSRAHVLQTTTTSSPIRDIRLYTSFNMVDEINPFQQLVSNLLGSFAFEEEKNESLTQSQIELATKSVLFNNILNPINNVCPITHEPFTDTQKVCIINHCKHIFTENSILLWFQRSTLCPVCKYDLSTYRAPQLSQLN
jgi:hypothetical protein